MKPAALEKALKEIKDSKGSTNLYDHLQVVFRKLLLDNPKNAFEKFEQYSFCFKGTAEEEVVFKVKESFSHLQQYSQEFTTLLGRINLGTEEEPQQPASIGHVPNLMNENRLLEMVGVGLGEDESYLVFKSLSRLAAQKSASNVRFWGRILGINATYYIAEGQAEGPDQMDMPPDTEPRGTGVNKLTYWACTKLCDKWTQLPTVSPYMIRTSRRIKKMLTGNLNTKIISNPHFGGKEVSLLKCIIVRITAACTIVPRGMYTLTPDDPKEVILAEEWKCPDARTLSTPQNWVHQVPGILKCGRLTHFKPEGIDPADEQNYLKELEKKDPLEPKLKSISLDRGAHTWKIKLYGEAEEVKTLTKDGKTQHLGVVSLKNLTWPGWTTLHHSGRTFSTYCGYGFKSHDLYHPSEPENILTQQADRSEMPQPQ